MSHAWRVNDSEGFQLHALGAEVVEEADTAAKQHRHQVDLYLIEQARPEALLADTFPQR